jgi:hypothetical protein
MWGGGLAIIVIDHSFIFNVGWWVSYAFSPGQNVSFKRNNFFFYLWKTNYRYIHIMRATHDLIKGTHVMSKYKHVHVYDICKILHMFNNLFNSSVQREKTNTYVLFICIAHLLAKGSLALILRYDLC